MRKALSFILVVTLVFSLCGCTNSTKNPVTSNQDISSEEAKELTSNTANHNQPVPDDFEIKRALELSIVPEEIQKSWDEQITYKQFCTMLQKVIDVMDKASVDRWQEIAKLALASDKKIKRQEGMLALYYAADILGAADTSNYNWDRMHESIGEPWDEMSFNYPEFPHWEDIAPFENQGWNYMSSAYFYSMGRASLYTNETIFDYDKEKNSMRPNEALTVKEAVLAAVRLIDSIIVYAEMEEAAVNTISKDTIENAKRMPAVSPQKLPKWYGYSIALWDNPTCYNWRYFSENTIKQLSDLGFNFVRMVYHMQELFVEKDGKYIVNLTTFENLDDIITWCEKYNMHITVQLHQIPGMGTNGVEGVEQPRDILENPSHYQQALQIYDFISKRYANVSTNLLSYTLLSEPPTSYFTFETHAKLVEDLAASIRKNDPERLIMAAALMDGGGKDHWVEATYFQPNYLLDNSIVQVESFYPWHNLRRSAYTQLMNGWPYDEAVVVSNVVNGESKPLTLKGNFKAGSEVTYYVTGVNNINAEAYALCEADGIEVGRYELSGFEEGKDNCSHIYENSIADFGDNGQYNGLEIAFKLNQDTSSIDFSVQGTDAIYVSLSDIMIKTPTDVSAPYIVVDNRYQPTGINYEEGNFSSVIIHCSEIWEKPASTVTVNPDGTYTCEQKYKRDVFDLNSMRAYYDKWEAWSKETGGSYFDFEFISTLSMPVEIRTAYMRSILEVFQEYDVSWVFSADLSQCGGIITYKGAEDMSDIPNAKTLCILPADGSYSLNTDYDYDCYYDDAVISVMKEYMK